MQNRLLTVTLVLCAVLLVIGLLPVHGEEAVYDTVVRLHVLANSDSEEDQALKLKVRDAVLAATEPMLVGCETQEDAKAALEANLGQLESIAQAVVEGDGFSDPVVVTLGEEEYPTRNYENFCFPAGSYLSLRICIGDAAGQNWWCCVFPPLCLGAASKTDAEEDFVEVGLTPQQYKIITESERPVYRVRFKLLEVFQSWG